MMDSNFVIMNGKLVRKEEANINVYNKANFFDFAVYSNIKIVNGKMFLPMVEIDKLFESAEKIGIMHPFEKKKILEWIELISEKNKLKDALVRILLIGQEKDSEPILFLFPVGLTFYPEKFYNQGVKLITYSGERFMPTSKTKNLLMSYLAYREAEKGNAIDALLVDREGNIREGTRTSFYAIKDNALVAPPAEKVLPGVTRKVIFDIAPKKMKVKEEDIPFEKIGDYDGCFISGTTVKIMPVNQIDEIKFKVGPKVKEFQRLFKEYVENYTHKQFLST